MGGVGGLLCAAGDCLFPFVARSNTATLAGSRRYRPTVIISTTMYPAHYLSLVPPFARTPRVFVAMSFDAAFDPRWNDVIVPAVSAVRTQEERLIAHRVDLTSRGDSILTEILDEIASSRLILADLSTVGHIDGRPVRNSNVFYELGLAHSARMPEEVIALRSDDDPLPFDIANVRIHSYKPDIDPESARARVTSLLEEALRTIDDQRSRTVERIASALDFECFDVLYDIGVDGMTSHPSRQDIVEQRKGLFQVTARIAAIQRLLEVGAISTRYQRITARHIGGYSELPRQDLARYIFTPLGEAVLHFVLHQMDYFGPEARAAFAILRDREAAL